VTLIAWLDHAKISIIGTVISELGPSGKPFVGWWPMLSRQKREIIGFFAAGAAAIIGAGWAVFVYLVPSNTHEKPARCNVEARESAAACGNITGNVTIDPSGRR
jgi:hypothetical protein